MERHGLYPQITPVESRVKRGSKMAQMKESSHIIGQAFNGAGADFTDYFLSAD
jgi:hypothetical protein